MLLRIVYSVVWSYAQFRRSLCCYDCQCSWFVGYFVVTLLLFTWWCKCIALSGRFSIFPADVVSNFICSQCSFHCCSECWIFLAVCLLVAVCCDSYRASCNRQLFCLFNISRIFLFIRYTYFNRLAVWYICCRDISRILCPIFSVYTVFNL